MNCWCLERRKGRGRSRIANTVKRNFYFLFFFKCETFLSQQVWKEEEIVCRPEGWKRVNEGWNSWTQGSSTGNLVIALSVISYRQSWLSRRSSWLSSPCSAVLYWSITRSKFCLYSYVAFYFQFVLRHGFKGLVLTLSSIKKWFAKK